MDSNEYIPGTICDLLNSRTSLILASILSVQGSSPRHNGTKMLIAENGKSYGTIGGSLLEATVIEESKKILLRKQSNLMTFELTGQDTQSTGMICGGKVLVLLDFLEDSSENKEFFKHWHNEVVSGRDIYLVTQIKCCGSIVNVVSRSIIHPDGKTWGKDVLTPDSMNILKSELHNTSVISTLNLGESQVILDPIRKMKSVFLFGAGHVALPTAQIAAQVGFRVTVLDDRSEYANAERFPVASEIRLIKNFNQAFVGLPIDADSCIVILTRGHQFDREVLEQALKTSAGYVGMISSRKKREAIYSALMDKGITNQELERVHSPIGLDIRAETPEEIAVSIVAELIREKNKKNT